MPDPTARMTRKPRVSALAIAALIAAVVVACVAVYFFAMESKEWIPFAGMMCIAVALLIYGVVELAAHSRDVRRWREYEVAYDEVTDPEGSWWGDDSDNEVSDKDERLSTYSFGGDDENAGEEKEEDEPEETADEDDDHKDTTKAPIAAESYTPLDVLVAKRASKGNTQTPSTRDTMPGAGKNSIPPVVGSGSMPTPGAVTIPHVDETAERETAEVETAKEVDVDTSVDSDTAADTTVADKDEPDLPGEDDKHTDEDTAEDTETRVDNPAVKDDDTAAERARKSIAAVDFITGEFTYADSPVVDDDKDTEDTAATEDTETHVDNPVVDDKDSTTAAEDTDNTETRVDNPVVKDEDTKTDAATKTSKGGFNLLGFGKQDKE